MKARFVIALVLAFSGGWWLRGLWMPAPIQTPPVRTYTHTSREAEPQVIVVEKPVARSGRPAAVEAHPPASIEKDNSFEHFQTLLQQQQYSDAMLYYADQEPLLSTQASQQWGAFVTDFLAGKLNSGETEAFSELSDLWLQQHYGDTEVLLLVAQYKRNMGYYSEALQTYMQANTYAYTEQQRKRVQDEFQNFIFTRDADYSAREEWGELLDFYRQLNELDIATPAQQFRYAELLLMRDDEKTAYFVLDKLQGEAPAWAAKTQQLRKQYLRDGHYNAGKTQASGFQDAVAMQPVGSHYLLPVSINDNSSYTLLLDTGASITMLTEGSFAAAAGTSGWQELGWSFFNTANGVARGRMLQAERLQLGNYTLRDVRVAVQEADLGDGVDGLLGMNVLRQFQFQIDQDGHQLLLTPRD